MNQNTAAQENAHPLEELGQNIHSRATFLTFLRAFATHLQQRPDDWENRDLASYPSTMAAWIEDMDGFCQKHSEIESEQLTLEAAGGYPPCRPSFRIAQDYLAGTL